MEQGGQVAGLLKPGSGHGSGATTPGRSPEQRGGEQKTTMISGGKVQLKEKQNRRKGGERGACVRRRGNPS